MMKIQKLIAIGTALVLAGTGLSAATLKLDDGSSLEGSLLKIYNGKVHFKTSFAGELAIDQAKVVSLESEEAVFLRTESGEVFQGPVEPEGPGSVKVASTSGPSSTPLGSVVSAWSTSGEDPIVVAQRREWRYLAALDVSGASGNSENFGTSARFEAELEGPTDRLLFYGTYKYKETENIKSEDEQKGGVRYTNFFTDKLGWFVREELERDVFEGIDFRSTSAAGFTRKFYSEERFKLEGSAGISYRYESYSDPLLDDDGFPGLDFGVDMMWRFADWGKLVTQLTYLPSFDDFSDYLLEHESVITLPLDTANFYNFRLGMRNQYNSNPGPGREKTDTTYFAGLLLTWD